MIKRHNAGYAPSMCQILHHRPLSVKAKTSRAGRLRPARALTAKGRRCFWWLRGTYPKTGLRRFFRYGQRQRFPERAAVIVRQRRRALMRPGIPINASHRETHFQSLG